MGDNDPDFSNNSWMGDSSPMAGGRHGSGAEDVGGGQTQMPSAQVSPVAGQPFPQEPQLLGSVRTSAQIRPQI